MLSSSVEAAVTASPLATMISASQELATAMEEAAVSVLLVTRMTRYRLWLVSVHVAAVAFSVTWVAVRPAATVW